MVPKVRRSPPRRLNSDDDWNLRFRFDTNRSFDVLIHTLTSKYVIYRACVKDTSVTSSRCH